MKYTSPSKNVDLTFTIKLNPYSETLKFSSTNLASVLFESTNNSKECSLSSLVKSNSEVG